MMFVLVVRRADIRSRVVLLPGGGYGERVLGGASALSQVQGREPVGIVTDEKTGAADEAAPAVVCGSVDERVCAIYDFAV